MQFDLEDLTLDELDDVLDAAGMTFQDFEEGRIGPKALKAIAWVLMRRDNPDFTIEDAGKVTIKSLTEGLGKDDA